MLQHITEGRSCPSDNFQESGPNELHASTHGETLDEGNTGKQGDSQEKLISCNATLERLEQASSWKDEVRVRNMSAAKLGSEKSLMRFQSIMLLARAAVYYANNSSSRGEKRTEEEKAILKKII